MPSLSPSPVKRPSINQRTSSTQSLSSSGKAATKIHRSHVVAGRGHTRNVSHGKNLNKTGKVNSSTNLQAEAGRAHQRKRSGPGSPPLSPRPQVKRNQSHVILPKNTSHVNLRKNHSATALSKNVSHTALKRLGLPPPKRKSKDAVNRQEYFEIGNQSSEEEENEEGQWEDSTTQSPEMTRNNSKTSTPARIATPSQDPVHQKAPDPRPLHREHTSSPPLGFLRQINRSLPDLTQQPDFTPERSKKDVNLDPVLLHHNPRASRAPPAMSTISAHANTLNLPRTDSSRSFTHIDHDDAMSPQALAANESSIEGGVSHFFPGTTPSRMSEPAEDGSEDDLPSSFLPNYHPMPSQSPDKQRSGGKGVRPPVQSRTQQRLELQRREIMRAGGTPTTTPPHSGIGPSLGSSASLHSRSGSRSRNRSMAGAVEGKQMKREYDAGVKQLDVVRKFRSPILNSLNRLKSNGVLSKDTGVLTPAGAGSLKNRPPSRRGLLAVNGAATNGTGRPSSSLENRRPGPLASRDSSHGINGKSQHDRRESHDDIGISFEAGRSTGSDDEDEADAERNGGAVDGGFSREEALIRRIWESRDVFDRPHSRMSINGGVEVR